MRLRFLVLVICLIAGVAIAWFGWREVFGPAVVVAPPLRGPAVAAVYATGTVEPVTWAQVKPMVSAQIVAFASDEGQAVAPGEMLARLDDAGERARLAELQAKMAFLEQESERYRRLVDNRTVSLQTWERVVSDLRQAKAAVTVARERLDDYTLVSPIAGEVLRRDGEIGEIVGPNDVVFWIGQPRPLRIEAEVDEEDIPRVAPGQAVLIKSDAFAGKVFDGTVARITPLGDPINKSFRVYIALPDDTPLRIGMTVELNIVTRLVADTWLVPATALRDAHIFVVEKGRAVLRAVNTGIVGIELVEIRDGIAADDRVVSAPPADLRDGARVRIRNPGGNSP